MGTRIDTVDHYERLGIDRAAGEAEIRRAYRRHARRLHPDVNHASDAQERFAALTEAYEVLSDPARRAAYDGRQPGSKSSRTKMTSASEERLRGVPGQPSNEPSLRGLDVYHTVYLSLRDAAFGTNKTVAVARREICTVCHGEGAAPHGTVRQCPRCHGTGRGNRRGEECARCLGNGGLPSIACPRCSGRGRVDDTAEFPLHFPGSIDTGMELRIKDQGDPGPRGGPRGDLRLTIIVEPDPILTRHGADVYATIILTPEEAARGGPIRVPTLRRIRTLTLPTGVQNGSQFVMRGQGLRLKGQWRRGDQHVTIRIEGQTDE